MGHSNEKTSIWECESRELRRFLRLMNLYFSAQDIRDMDQRKASAMFMAFREQVEASKHQVRPRAESGTRLAGEVVAEIGSGRNVEPKVRVLSQVTGLGRDLVGKAAEIAIQAHERDVRPLPSNTFSVHIIYSHRGKNSAPICPDDRCRPGVKDFWLAALPAEVPDEDADIIAWAKGLGYRPAHSSEYFEFCVWLSAHHQGWLNHPIGYMCSCNPMRPFAVYLLNKPRSEIHGIGRHETVSRLLFVRN